MRSAESHATIAVSLGEGTTCATLVAGQAKCWGRGDEGRLGRGTGEASDEVWAAAADFVSLGFPATEVVTNGAQTFALLADGRVRAFGVNSGQELGLGHPETVGDDETPSDASVSTVVPLAGPSQQVVAGEEFACARLDDGRVQCWGRGDAGQLGRDAGPGVHGPEDVSLGGPVVEITAGVAHACARRQTGAIRCWGLGDRGQLGYGVAALPGSTPASVGDVPLGGVATAVVAGGDHTCALLLDGQVRCWGDNEYGQLGYGHTLVIGDDETPAMVGDVALGGAAVSVVAGLRHTCALLDEGTVRCWGEGASGQLGLGSVESVGDDETPVEVAAVELSGVEAIFTNALAEHTCALRGDGALRCWGLNEHGQLGLGWVDPGVEGPPGELPDVIVVEDPDL